MPQAVVTGCTAGVGRAVALCLARKGYDVGLIGRDRDRLTEVAGEVRATGRRALELPVDVADAEAVDAAAARFENEIGPIDIWINSAMVTVLAPVLETSAAEYTRVTEVTYLGTVHGTRAALSRMRPRGLGTILQVGSALAYRSIPLQSAYCAAKSAVVGFTDSLRSELLHEKSNVALSVIHLPAVNTPQFDWALNKMRFKAQPVPPIFDPERVAEQIVRAARNPRREYWLGVPAAKAILSYELAPWLGDRMLAGVGYEDQLTDAPEDPARPNNLFDPVPGNFGARGRFSDRMVPRRPILISPAMRRASGVLACTLLGAAAFTLGALVF